MLTHEDVIKKPLNVLPATNGRSAGVAAFFCWLQKLTTHAAEQTASKALYAEKYSADAWSLAQ